MKRAIRVFLWVGIGALSLAPWASAQSVTLTSPGNNVADGVYVSPYYATVNGATNTPIVESGEQPREYSMGRCAGCDI